MITKNSRVVVIMRRMKLIYNPTAGNEFFSYQLPEVIVALNKGGIAVDPFPTEAKGHGRQLAMTAKDQGYDIIGIAGGDGSINEVINGIAHEEQPLPIGIFPAGTANDVAKVLKIPQDFIQCCAVIAKGNKALVDIGKANDRYFINVAAGGLLTNIPYKVSREAKTLFGKMAYYVKGLEEIPKFRPFELKIKHDQEETVEKVMLFVVANGSTIGGFSRIAPDAKMDDGLLDVYIVKQLLWKDVPDLFLRLLNRTHRLHPAIAYFQAHELVLSAVNEHINIDLDGEMGSQLPVSFEILPKRVKVFVP